GGGKASTQEELRPAGAFGGVRRALGAISAPQLRGGGPGPIGIERIQQAADARIGQAVALQFGAQAHRAVALGDAAADQYFGETLVILVVLGAEAVQGFIGFLAGVAVATQLLAQLTAGVFATREQAQRLVV